MRQPLGKHRFVLYRFHYTWRYAKRENCRSYQYSRQREKLFPGHTEEEYWNRIKRGLDESTADIDKRLEELQAELIQLANSKESYDNIVNEIYRLRDLRQETLSRNALRQDKRDRIAEMTDFINTQTGDITEFDDKLVRKLVEKAIVYDRLMVEFKSGLEIEVNL